MICSAALSIPGVGALPSEMSYAYASLLPKSWSLRDPENGLAFWRFSLVVLSPRPCPIAASDCATACEPMNAPAGTDAALAVATVAAGFSP